MDTGKGRFEMAQGETEEELKKNQEILEAVYPKHGGWFREGEFIELKGSLFQITRVTPLKLVLKLKVRS
jgi:hypothetical protein